ncbi:MFS transporter [Thioalkalivibrio denitrificans]|uniref:MFS transporter n=1 Tax=Thioalkalivibrio denitrificans TaxID=108003 RepID=A0A1V3NDN5_9GAMM|nr:MFS transporter [Thioalkalivibrio denitrificans]OOG23161.1 MFS transporter [Thioalkalivibrio denitrificans]
MSTGHSSPDTFLHRYPITVIVLAQLFGTSLWFSINGVALSLQRETGMSEADLGLLTVGVQAGFITGTVLLAATGLADRVRASRLFTLAAVTGALVNGAFIPAAHDLHAAWLLRFATGLCLAGIYPLGMKLVVSWTPKHAGLALGWLLGMLTLGIALPHLLRGATLELHWQWPLLIASLLALAAAVMVHRLGDGPHLPPTAGSGPPWAGLAAFARRPFRAAAFGYFGHCWELFAFWTLAPLLVLREITRLDWPVHWLPWLAFGVIAVGGAGCVLGGRISRSTGSLSVARWALGISGSLCLLYPWLGGLPPVLLLCLLLVWGFTVIADSPQFTALASLSAPRDRLGAALALMNAIGFGLTIPSIAVVTRLWPDNELAVLWLMLPGPVLGLWALSRVGAADYARAP